MGHAIAHGFRRNTSLPQQRRQVAQEEIRKPSWPRPEFQDSQRVFRRRRLAMSDAIREEVSHNLGVDYRDERIVGDVLRDHVLSPGLKTALHVELALPAP